MIAEHLATWLSLLQIACEQAGTRHLHLIIDQAGSEAPLLPSVLSVEPPLAWYSLFTGLPEEGAADLAPLLVRVDLAQPLQRQWLLGLMHATDGHSQLLVLASAWPFAVLAEHLSRCLEARNGGVLGLLRYYDPRLFPLLFSHVLQPAQQQPLLRPALFWSWLDRDGSPRYLLGAADLPAGPDTHRTIELSDSQIDTLGCASDATAAVARLSSAFPREWGMERRFRACYRAMLEASKAGVLLADQREAYALDQLRQAAMAHPASTGRQ
ncbi:DUF4123 domain-containing protein [Pseudomonas sp. Irchel 3F5]|uniref:DUF4123 domain-containing protein n=1 Tax=Pseudomonas sp. Irchel 3F5 TaxID=2009002 RepID=UPI000BA3D436|nr:DUF4123 domain-containing protein [Pseudomonas sp. Irchel 3F5]